MESSAGPLAAAACCSASCAWSARTLRTSARVDSTDAAAIRISTATGWPLEVMTKSSLPADFNHWLADFFFSSLTEIVLMAKGYVVAALCASRAEAQTIFPSRRSERRRKPRMNTDLPRRARARRVDTDSVLPRENAWNANQNGSGTNFTN